MNILSIETSCDDTCVAIVKAEGRKKPCFNILSNIVSSQTKIHQKWGGVYPTLAKREHQRNLILVLRKALKESNFLSAKRKAQSAKLPVSPPTHRDGQLKTTKLKDILQREPELLDNLIKFLKKYQKPKVDAIAVTVGPGLEPCLWTGVNFARALGFSWNLPIIAINHLKAHIIANFISKQRTMNNEQLFPAVCLIVSGGHTQLILMKDFGKYKILGETKDDAAGECFDKTARILELGYPGGPEIEKEAKLRNTKYKIQDTRYKIQLPRPMIHQKNYDFSFSGLKTAVLYYHKNQSPKIRKSKEYIALMCAEIQQAIIDVLIAKTIKAAKEHKARTIILGGGVTANKELRKQIKEKIKKEIPNTTCLIPDVKYSTDNAAMVGITAYYHWSTPLETRLGHETQPHELSTPLRDKSLTGSKGKTKNWREIQANANLRV